MPEQQFDLTKAIGTLSNEQLQSALQRARKLRVQTPPIVAQPPEPTVEARPPTEASALQPEQPPAEIVRYTRPWQEEIGPGPKIGLGYSTGMHGGVYRPQAHPDLAVKVFEEKKWQECFQELEALKKLHGLRHVVNLVGYRYEGARIPDNYLVKRFVDGEIMLEKILLGQNPTRAGEILRTALTPEERKQVAVWLITAMESLAEIHSRGIVVSDFKFSDWPWDRQNKRAVIIDLGNAVDTRSASYNRSVTEHEDTNDILKAFFFSTNLGRVHQGGVDIKVLYTGTGTHLDGSLEWPIGTAIELLKTKTQESGTLESLKRIIQLMEEELDYRVNATALTKKRNFASEYANALKAYFTEVGLYG